MRLLLPLAVAVATASFVPASFAGPSDSAIDNANSNAKFLRCGTEHPSAADAVKQEKRFRELFRQSQNGKKPDRPGGGNGNGGGGGRIHPQLSQERAVPSLRCRTIGGADSPGVTPGRCAHLPLDGSNL